MMAMSESKDCGKKMEFWNSRMVPLLAMVVGAAMLWWLGTVFVTKEQYRQDQINLNTTLSEIKTDVKELLKGTRQP